MEIFKKMALINKEIEPIAKAMKNTQQNFMYRGIEQFLNDLHNIIAKHDVFIMPEVVSHEQIDRVTKSGSNLIFTNVVYKFTFYTTDGSSVSSTIRGEGMDSADKGSNKALSVALKYALSTIFTIPLDLKDPDSESHEQSSKKVDEKYNNKPLLTPAHEKWEEVAKWLAKPGNTIGKIELKYNLPADMKEELIQKSITYTEK